MYTINVVYEHRERSITKYIYRGHDARAIRAVNEYKKVYDYNKPRFETRSDKWQRPRIPYVLSQESAKEIVRERLGRDVVGGTYEWRAGLEWESGRESTLVEYSREGRERVWTGRGPVE